MGFDAFYEILALILMIHLTLVFLSTSLVIAQLT